MPDPKKPFLSESDGDINITAPFGTVNGKVPDEGDKDGPFRNQPSWGKRDQPTSGATARPDPWAFMSEPAMPPKGKKK